MKFLIGECGFKFANGKNKLQKGLFLRFYTIINADIEEDSWVNGFKIKSKK